MCNIFFIFDVHYAVSSPSIKPGAAVAVAPLTVSLQLSDVIVSNVHVWPMGY